MHYVHMAWSSVNRRTLQVGQESRGAECDGRATWQGSTAPCSREQAIGTATSRIISTLRHSPARPRQTTSPILHLDRFCPPNVPNEPRRGTRERPANVGSIRMLGRSRYRPGTWVTEQTGNMGNTPIRWGSTEVGRCPGWRQHPWNNANASFAITRPDCTR
jgi:hypothetical protein